MGKAEEQILVVERRLVESCGVFHGLTFHTEKYLPVLLDNRNYRFVPRGAAEKDPSLKQLIPYFLLCWQDRLWTYVRSRKSGEERLVAKASIGVGGHMNHLDENLFEDIYQRAATRELEEEVELPPGYSHRIVALLNDDSNPVGSVHLGVVHVLQTPSPDVRPREGALVEAGFKTVDELRALRDRLETWSQICFDHIGELLARGRATP